MKKFLSSALLSLVLCFPVFSSAADNFECVSPHLVRVLEDAIGKTAALFNDARYAQRYKIDGRRVLALKDLDPGVPKNWSIPDSTSYAGIRRILNNGGSNLDLMKAGYAPIGKDGKQLNIHHLFGEEPGPVAEIEKTIHQANHGALHQIIDGSFRKDPEKLSSWNAFYRQYWKDRAKDFI